MTRELLLEVRGPDLVHALPIDLEAASGVDLVRRYNNVGTWALALRADSAAGQLLATPTYGLTATIDGALFVGGPTTSIVRTRKRGEAVGLITCAGVTDDCILGDALAYPVPSDSTMAGQAGAAYDVRTGIPPDVMRAYVNAGIGPAAATARKNALLDLGTTVTAGTSATWAARFEVLGDLLTRIAAPAGLGFRIRQTVTGTPRLKFDVYQPVDRHLTVRLDVENETLGGYEWTSEVPTLTRAVVAGGGAGTARVLREVTTAASAAAETLWARRRESFIDQRQTSATAELDQAGEEALATDGRTQTAIKIDPADTQDATILVDYGLGDRITVVVDRLEVTDIITEVNVRYGTAGLTVSAAAGNVDTTFRNSAIRALLEAKRNARRLSQLERRV